jgi:(p)ppGpp synthase/HD superfamily hydrolase
MDRYGAMKLAIKAHDVELDKGGRLYVLHPLAVARMVAPLGEDFEVVGWLHDVVEDTKVSMEDVERRCTRSQASGVCAMTRVEGETYNEYLDRLIEDMMAPFVKLADHAHNSSPERLATLPPEQRGIVSRYQKGSRRIVESQQFQSLLAGLAHWRPRWEDDPGLGWLTALTS